MPLFVGNVLPSSDAPGENDSTFDFTREESESMSLRNIPIRLEHEEGLAVGHVKRDWTDSDGKKWILGHVDDNTLEGRYASNAIRPKFEWPIRYTRDCRYSMCIHLLGMGPQRKGQLKYLSVRNLEGRDAKLRVWTQLKKRSI